MNDYLLNLQIYSFSGNPPNNKAMAAKKGELKDNHEILKRASTGAIISATTAQVPGGIETYKVGCSVCCTHY
ncbi:MAG: hypothetical protein PUJ13_01660 [Bacteroidales bacterium]|nr:hypothetical protein [Bacteroidales bacterium]MDY4705081.1 hypothetical protein [Prevotella sp.]MCI7653966.1 hypothetical protein [Bacteroidales bacterium]MDD7705083.1 hypothetical protein [Bacteroidales bacterium]MDY4951809.1 hypothetical protein [Prevotella sp.]